MVYTVHEVAKLAGVTIKTLYHYQKIDLLQPESIAENGYRFYGEKELEKLQQILFYRELDFSLERIKKTMMNESSRLECLYEQKSLLEARQERMEAILSTLEDTIYNIEKGVPMNKETMFAGLNKQDWEKNISEQNDHLQKNYGIEIEVREVEVSSMNKRAKEAEEFMSFMATSLKNGVSVSDESITDAIEKHVQFMQNDMSIDAQGFAAQSRFLMLDDFHRQMMEGQQTGLSYYICFAAESYASK